MRKKPLVHRVGFQMKFTNTINVNGRLIVPVAEFNIWRMSHLLRILLVENRQKFSFED